MADDIGLVEDGVIRPWGVPTTEHIAAWRAMRAQNGEIMAEQVPSIGRIVHYVLEAGPHQGEHRPALIVQVWGNTPVSLVNLQVFVDGSNDYFKNQGPEPLTLWRTSVHRDDNGAPETWHWPEYVAPVEEAA